MLGQLAGPTSQDQGGDYGHENREAVFSSRVLAGLFPNRRRWNELGFKVPHTARRHLGVCPAHWRRAGLTSRRKILKRAMTFKLFCPPADQGVSEGL